MCKFNMFITAVCVLFLIKLRWATLRVGALWRLSDDNHFSLLKIDFACWGGWNHVLVHGVVDGEEFLLLRAYTAISYTTIKKQIISFFKEAHFNSSVRLLLELYCVILMEDFTSANLTMAFTFIYQFTFEPLHFCSRMWLWFRIWTIILVDGRIW